MLTPHTEIIEGTWEEVSRQSVKFDGHRVRVVILQDEPFPVEHKMITKGMFPQLATIDEEDFKIAEFHGDPASYQKIEEGMERQRLIAAIREGERAIQEGRTRPAEEVFAEMKTKYGF